MDMQRRAGPFFLSEAWGRLARDGLKLAREDPFQLADPVVVPRLDGGTETIARKDFVERYMWWGDPIRD